MHPRPLRGYLEVRPDGAGGSWTARPCYYAPSLSPLRALARSSLARTGPNNSGPSGRTSNWRARRRRGGGNDETGGRADWRGGAEAACLPARVRTPCCCCRRRPRADACGGQTAGWGHAGGIEGRRRAGRRAGMQVGGAAGGHASEMIKLGRLAGASSAGWRVDSSQLRAAAVI